MRQVKVFSDFTLLCRATARPDSRLSGASKYLVLLPALDQTVL